MERACRAGLRMSTNPNVKETAVVQQRSAYLHIKRAQDVVLSLVGLVVLMPILLLIALILGISAWFLFLS